MSAAVEISLAVKNNRNYPLELNIMGSPVNPRDTSNAYTEYRYDFSSFNFTNENYVQILYKRVGDVQYSTFTAQLQSPTLQAIVIALNQLGIGYFNLYTEGSNTFIGTNNDNYVFGGVNVYNVSQGILNPAALYDFNINSYNNASSSVGDLTGDGYNGTTVQGTGVGTPIILGDFPYVPPPPLGYLNMPSQSTGNQYAVLLPDTFKFAGTSPYTIMAWINSSNTTFLTDAFQGIVAAEGRNPARIGYSFDLVFNGGEYYFMHERWQGSTNASDVVNLIFGVNVADTFTPNTWYFVMVGYDGTNMYLSLYANGVRYDNQTITTTSLDTDAAWGAFIGLRYNNWFNGEIGFVSIYNKWTTTAEFDNIYNNTKTNYGY